jgi:hypothetical protein
MKSDLPPEDEFSRRFYQHLSRLLRILAPEADRRVLRHRIATIIIRIVGRMLSKPAPVGRPSNPFVDHVIFQRVHALVRLSVLGPPRPGASFDRGGELFRRYHDHQYAEDTLDWCRGWWQRREPVVFAKDAKGRPVARVDELHELLRRHADFPFLPMKGALADGSSPETVAIVLLQYRYRLTEDQIRHALQRVRARQ